MFIFIFCNALFGAPADTLWTATFGGAKGDCSYSVQRTAGDGFIITGATESFGAGGYDVYLVKTNPSGNAIWSQTFGGANSDFGYSVLETPDNGYIVSGGTFSFGSGEDDVYIIKVTSSGDTMWTRVIGGPGSDYGYSIQPTSDSGFIIVGSTDSYGAGAYDIYLIRITSSGDTMWTRAFGGFDFDYGCAVQQTLDGGFIIAGGLNFQGMGGDAYLVKTDSAGDTLWTKVYGDKKTDQFYSVQQTSDGGFIVAGGTYSYGSGASDMYVVKTNPSGDSLWTRAFGGSKNEWAYAVREVSDSGFVIAGYTSSYGAGDEDMYIVKTNLSGEVSWTTTFGGSGAERCYSVQETKDVKFIITGETASFGAGSNDVWLIRTGTIGAEEKSNIKNQISKLTASPNPFLNSTIIQTSTLNSPLSNLSIYDISGNLVEETGESVVGKNLKAGIYFVKVKGCKPIKIIKTGYKSGL